MILADVNEILSKRMIAKQRRRNGWTQQPCLDVRISVLNKTLQRSIQRRYPAFQTPNDQPALNYSGYQIKKSVQTNCARSSAGPNQPSSAAPAPPPARFSPSAPHQSCVSSSSSSSAPFSKQSGQLLTPLVPKIGSISQKPPDSRQNCVLATRQESTGEVGIVRRFTSSLLATKISL